MSGPQHLFEMNLTPAGHNSRIYLDTINIGELIQGVTIESGIDMLTRVDLHSVVGAGVELKTILPESQVVVHDHRPDEDYERLRAELNVFSVGNWRYANRLAAIRDTYKSGDTPQLEKLLGLSQSMQHWLGQIARPPEADAFDPASMPRP